MNVNAHVEWGHVWKQIIWKNQQKTPTDWSTKRASKCKETSNPVPQHRLAIQQQDHSAQPMGISQAPSSTPSTLSWWLGKSCMFLTVIIFIYFAHIPFVKITAVQRQRSLWNGHDGWIFISTQVQWKCVLYSDVKQVKNIFFLLFCCNFPKRAKNEREC